MQCSSDSLIKKKGKNEGYENLEKQPIPKQSIEKRSSKEQKASNTHNLFLLTWAAFIYTPSTWHHSDHISLNFKQITGTTLTNNWVFMKSKEDKQRI